MCEVCVEYYSMLDMAHALGLERLTPAFVELVLVVNPFVLK